MATTNRLIGGISMNNNGNGHHCNRCLGGVMIRDYPDGLCLNCGHRVSNASKRQIKKDYISEAIVARLQHNGNGDLHDVKAEDCELAGMAAK